MFLKGAHGPGQLALVRKVFILGPGLDINFGLESSGIEH